MSKYRMNEPWGYQEANNYISQKSMVDNELTESKQNDKKELADIEELKKKKVDGASYDKNAKKINLTANGKVVASIDATDFVKDGMVESVTLDGTVLTITFNTESGKESISVDFKDIFDEDAYYTKEEVDNLLADKADASALDELSTKLDEKADKSELANYALKTDLKEEDVQAAVSGKADSENVYTKAEVDETVAGIEEEMSAFSGDVASLNAKDEELQGEIDLKAAQSALEALSGNVYTKDEADEKFLTEHQDISGLATKDEVESGITALAASIALVEGQIASKADADSVYTKEEVDAAIEGFAAESAVTEVADALSAESERAISAETELLVAVSGKADADVVYTQEEVDALLAEKEEEMQQKYKGLKDMVLDLYYATSYSVPTDCGLDTMLKSNNGEAKLTEDLTIGTIAAGQTAKNIVKLNLGGKTVTFTGSTTTNPAMMFRNKQQINIGGSGTVDAGGRIAVEAYGADCEITLSGTMFGRPTYVTDRSGGELIYCYLGTINITEGIFKNNGDDKTFLLNCYDVNYRNGTAKIIVTGGKFYDFDPGNNTAEGEGTSFLAEGYHSEASTVVEEGVEHTVYTVKKD